MKKHVLFTSILCLMVLLFATACKSTPEPEPDMTTDPSSSVIDVPVEPEIPVEPEVPAEPEIPAVDYTTSNAEFFATAVAARESAQTSGADVIFPDAFKSADADYENVKMLYEEKPSADLSSQIEDVTAKYRALETAVIAQSLRERIIELNFIDSDPSALQRGDDSFAALVDLYGANASGAQMLAQAEAARDSYNQVLSTGFKSLASDERHFTAQFKLSAEEIKAHIADKAGYAEAARVFSNADSAFAAGDYEAAYSGFMSAHVAFREIFERISAKRSSAQDAIDRAQQKIDTTAVFAAEADELAPIQEPEVQE